MSARPFSITGRFCWMDLAATDADRAKDFYGELFGWTPQEQAANGGVFTKLQIAGQDVGSIYQLRRAYLDAGIGSHWTPYVEVDDVDAAVTRATELGGKVIITPFTIEGIARLALILDSVGAHLGLWESTAAQEVGHA